MSRQNPAGLSVHLHGKVEQRRSVRKVYSHANIISHMLSVVRKKSDLMDIYILPHLQEPSAKTESTELNIVHELVLMEDLCGKYILQPNVCETEHHRLF